MPRRYYRRRTTVVRPKKRWASNIKVSTYIIDGSTPSPALTLVANPSQASTPTPVIIKAGNFKVNADIRVSLNSTGVNNVLQLVAVVIFVPQGVSVGNNQLLGDLIANHPEYIMAWRQFDFTDATLGGNNSQSVVFSSRLKRNLNSGDSIVFGILESNTQGISVSAIDAAVTAQYWTCSN